MNTHVVRDHDLFLITSSTGEVSSDQNEAGLGLYTKDTRFLSANALKVNGKKPKLLAAREEGYNLSSFRLMHEEPDKGAVEILRTPFIHNGTMYEKVTFKNYFPYEYNCEAVFHFEADFQDMFIVRGFRTGETGDVQPSTQGENTFTLNYSGKDGVKRSTAIRWKSDATGRVEEGDLIFPMNLRPQEETSIVFTITPAHDGQSAEPIGYDEAKARLVKSYEEWEASFPKLSMKHPAFDGMYKQGIKDMKMLLVDVGYGDIPVAGTPWYAVPFGRDSIITTLFMLSSKPELAKNTLRTLGAYQGKEVNKERDEEPGKIMHELRFGELSTTGQTPFTPYYGTVDATSLFLYLAAEYYHWTADDDLIKELKPSLDAALAWIRSKETARPNGFVSYHKQADKGIPNQGWKDSSNSMVHKDGAFAASPISLVEVQGYVYAAKKGLSAIYETIGWQDESDVLKNEALKLQEEIDNHFWVEKEQYYALALDENDEQVQSVTSNPGHLLLAEVKRDASVVKRLFAPDLNNGYGIRTMSDQEKGYNPLSYHNGSVWPHDNGMCLLGLSKKGYTNEAAALMKQLLDASLEFEDQRLPELYCGHDRQSEGLVPYPTTCSPQAWAAATALLYTQAVTGLNPDGVSKTVTVNPAFLEGVEKAEVTGVKLGEGYLSLKLMKTDNGYDYSVVENTSGYEVVPVTTRTVSKP
ncbi:amylo-alpha-1,6-glucosidase [Alteribacter keqinensis]|uniref:Amylo-alpha-1,6-glucosidase n=1 Tax=Alteribacter keqinensis TaxID=2483800 RepID=A0A3M7TQS8_9BACI|nr:glycogen debranching N-terminal domain-containing protein [Alteribacter keqinensis]RNA67617.1 amylo-alpha-1,6-glucosidase [Alteribacter keqinensis]